MNNFFTLILEARVPLFSVSFSLIIAILLLTKASLNMIEKKRIDIFMPFFILGFGVCLGAGFILYDFYGITSDIFLISKFVLMVGIFFILWRSDK